MKKSIGIVILFLAVFFVIKMIRANPTTDKTMRIGSQTLFIEEVSTPEKITKGLGERDTLGSDGMLFVMPSRGIPAFWMKGMRFDLDFIWIDGDRVVDVTENVRLEPGIPESSLRIYSPRYPVTHVLELNAGEIKKRDIKVGDPVQFSY
jgi:uncharacterized protein